MQTEYIIYEGKKVRKSGKGEYKPRPFMKGRVAWNKGIPNTITQERNRTNNPTKRGAEHPRWKGGITPQRVVERNTPAYRAWKKAIFARDGRVCSWCGITEGRMDIDHIKPVRLYPELLLALDNGRVLCKECHIKSAFPCRNCACMK